MNFKEIEALIKLLSDDDSFILDQVEGKLNEYFKTLPPSVWSQFLNSANEKSKERLKNLLEKFNIKYVIDLADNWLQNPTLLSEGLFIISRVFNPFLDYHEFLALIYQLIHYLPTEFANNYTDLEQAQIISHLFFKDLEFKWEHTPTLPAP
jgi:hypothetical protein